jgi:hypothetical protein
MRYIIVDPAKKTVTPANLDNIKDAQAVVGLTSVDHGMLRQDLAYCVYEYGLFVPPRDQNYFSIGNILFAGGAVFYGINDLGETVDIKSDSLAVTFYKDATEVEAAILAKKIERPIMAVNGQEIWRWPQQAPKGMGYGSK